MNKINKFLAAILVVQIVLLAARALWPESESKASGEVLLANFDPGAVTRLRITDSSDKTLVFEKDGEDWVLPDYGNYPVENARISALLDKLKAIKTDRLITRSTTSHRRLKVSSDEFERLLEIEAGETTHQLYLGKSSGGSTIHVRLDDQTPVYLVGNLTSQDANALPSSWIDTLYFSAASDQVVSLLLQNANGDFEFAKDGDTWTMTGLAAGETLNQNNLTSLLNTVTAFRISAPIGTEQQATFMMNAPQATITVRVLEAIETPNAAPDTSLAPLLTPTSAPATPEPTAAPQLVEKEYTLQIGAALDEGVVVKSSESDYYVLIAASIADRFTQKTRADFVTIPPTPTPEPTLAPEELTQAAPPPMSTPAASATAPPATP